MNPSCDEHWSISLIRIGNQAVREAQERNRVSGIANWYSMNGRLVSDRGDVIELIRPFESFKGAKKSTLFDTLRLSDPDDTLAQVFERDQGKT